MDGNPADLEYRDWIILSQTTGQGSLPRTPDRPLTVRSVAFGINTTGIGGTRSFYMQCTAPNGVRVWELLPSIGGVGPSEQARFCAVATGGFTSLSAAPDGIVVCFLPIGDGFRVEPGDVLTVGVIGWTPGDSSTLVAVSLR